MGKSTKVINPIFIFPSTIKSVVGISLALIPVLLALHLRVDFKHFPDRPEDLAIGLTVVLFFYGLSLFILNFVAKYIWILGYPNRDLLRTHLTASLRNLYFTVIESHEALYIPQRGSLIRFKKFIFLHGLHADGAFDSVLWQRVANEMLRLGGQRTGKSFSFLRHHTPARSPVGRSQNRD